MHVVFTCHLKQTEDGESGRIYFKPAIQGAVGDEIAGYVDLALLLKAQPVARQVDGESKRVMVRLLRTMPDPSYPWIKDRSGMLPEDLEINFSDDFNRIHDLIFGDMDSGGAIPETPNQATTTEVEVADVDRGEVDTGSEPWPVEEEVVPPVVDVDNVRSMTVAEKLKVAAPFPCEECGVAFSIDDQRDLSVLSRHRRILCSSCYKVLNKK